MSMHLCRMNQFIAEESRRKKSPQKGKHWSAFPLLMVLGCLLFQTLSPLDPVVSESQMQQCVTELVTGWVPITILLKPFGLNELDLGSEREK